MSDVINVPDFLDVNPEVQRAAQKAMQKGGPLDAPPDAKKDQDKKDPTKFYTRWTEPITIEAAWSEGTKQNTINLVLQYKVRMGSFNGGFRNWQRMEMNPRIVSGVADAEELKMAWKTEQSINGITNLLSVTKLLEPGLGLSKKLLNLLFPKKGVPGAASPLAGKEVVAQFLNTKAQKSEKYPYDTQTRIEAFLPSPDETLGETGAN